MDRKNDLAENHDVITRARGEDGEEGGDEGGEEGFPRTSMDIRSPVCRVRQMDGWVDGWKCILERIRLIDSERDELYLPV